MNEQANEVMKGNEHSNEIIKLNEKFSEMIELNENSSEDLIVSDKLVEVNKVNDAADALISDSLALTNKMKNENDDKVPFRDSIRWIRVLKYGQYKEIFDEKEEWKIIYWLHCEIEHVADPSPLSWNTKLITKRNFRTHVTNPLYGNDVESPITDLECEKLLQLSDCNVTDDLAGPINLVRSSSVHLAISISSTSGSSRCGSAILVSCKTAAVSRQ